MKVILIQDVKKLGRTGEIVDTSDGHARNFLIPQRLAKPVTPDVLRAFENAKKSQAGREALAAQKMREFTRNLANKEFAFQVAADDSGHLYAGLKESDILAKITKGGGSTGVKASLTEYTPIKTAGTHEVTLKAGSETVKVKIVVSAEINDK